MARASLTERSPTISAPPSTFDAPIPLRPDLTAGIDAQALHRAATTPDYAGWLQHVQPAAGCTRPVRLFGTVDTVQTSTGRILDRRHTTDLPDTVIYKACGNRRAAQCPDCAWIYQGDAYQVIRCGLTGGKSVDPSVATHPAVFVTLTAPSFGTVHTRAVHRHTCANRRRCGCRGEPCHARRDTPTCPHGQAGVCWTRHDPDDPRLGQPLCLDCYDHDHQVVWNHFCGELWRRTKQAIERHLTTLCRHRRIPPADVASDAGASHELSPVRVRHAKVAEMQRRGVVHLHVLLRLDGVDPADPDAVVPPPAGVGADDLVASVRAVAAQISLTTPTHPDRPQGWAVRWGTQVDIKPVGPAGAVTDAAAAAYLAKYATKSTEITGHCYPRLTAETIDTYADPVGDHLARLIDACWHLGRPTPPAAGQDHDDEEPGAGGQRNPYLGLRRWAHMLGFGGHFLTKARRYSITFTQLRQLRAAHRREGSEPDDVNSVATLTFAGAGWRTDGDALLANTAAALARERRAVGREELAHQTAAALATLQAA